MHPDIDARYVLLELCRAAGYVVEPVEMSRAELRHDAALAADRLVDQPLVVSPERANLIGVGCDQGVGYRETVSGDHGQLEWLRSVRSHRRRSVDDECIAEVGPGEQRQVGSHGPFVAKCSGGDRRRLADLLRRVRADIDRPYFIERDCPCLCAVVGEGAAKPSTARCARQVHVAFGVESLVVDLYVGPDA